MKRCPKCNQTFTDENAFCLSDGTPLTADQASQPTVVFGPPVPSGSHPAVKAGSNAAMFAMFGLILLLAVIAVGFDVAYFISNRSTNETNQAAKTQNLPSPSTEAKTTEQSNRDKHLLPKMSV